MFTPSTSDNPRPIRTLRALATLLTLLVGFSFAAQAQDSGLFDDYVSINGTFYKTNATSVPEVNYPSLQGASLGSFDRNSGVLTLNGGKVNSYERNGDQVNTANIYYRVYPGTTAPVGQGFLRLNLPLTSLGNDPVNGTDNRVFSTFASTINLARTTNIAGSYTLELYIQAAATYSNGGGSGSFVLNDTNGGANFKATFDITGTPQAATTWTGAINDNWFDPANWSNGVPTPTNNAVIPNFGPGVQTYPNIYSNGQAVAPNGTVIYDNMNTGPATCFTLLLQGNSQADRSICRLVTGTLKVYGDFYNQQDSFIPRENTTIEFAGGNQTISGGAQFVRVGISGSGVKALSGNMTIGAEIFFNGGVLSTDISNPTISYVELANRTTQNANNGAQINGETDASYLRGFVRTVRNGVQANEGSMRTFGNMGMSLEFVGLNSPGDVTVTRNTTESYNPLNDRYSIRRIFGVRPSDAATNTGGLTANMIFRYLDRDLQDLNANGDDIPEAELFLYVSTNAGSSWGQLGRDALNTNTNELTKNGVRTFATFTLGDRTAPLPVTLTAFDAKRAGTDVLLTWDTATEQNNKGFDLQVSTNGKEFRSLTFVDSKSPNSSQLQSYRYTDTTPNKAGTRYYRLRQVDQNGKENFFAPKTVTFDGRATSEASLAAYPNPFQGELRLTLLAGSNGTGQVQITDMTGRVITKQPVSLVAGTNEVNIPNASDLQAGIYLARFTSPAGEVTSVKVRKI